jgi:hypothetical protein
MLYIHQKHAVPHAHARISLIDPKTKSKTIIQTIENTREADETMVTPGDEEVALDEADDEFAGARGSGGWLVLMLARVCRAVVCCCLMPNTHIPLLPSPAHTHKTCPANT